MENWGASRAYGGGTENAVKRIGCAWPLAAGSTETGSDMFENEVTEVQAANS